MTNKSPRLPRGVFTLPAPPAPPNSPALLPPAPAKQDSFALRVVEGIELVKTYRVLDDVAGVEFPTSTTKSSLRLTRPQPAA